ncbi:MAG: cell division protein FtsQ/DivIB [Desulfovibrionaceae bacterium]
MAMVLAIVSMLLIVLLSWLQSLEYFTLRNIHITGTTRLPPHVILKMIDVYEGQNSLTVRVGEVYQKLLENPWIQKASVKRVLPDSLFINIDEADTYFWREYNQGLYYADALGLPIAPVDETFFVSLPVLEIEKGAQDLIVHIPSIVGELQKDIYPIEIKSLSWLRLTSEGKIVFFMENLGVEIEVELRKWQENLMYLRLVLNDLIDRGELRHVSKIKASDVVIVEK